MKKLLSVLSVCVMSLIYIAPASADFTAGVTFMAGTYETDGSETEATVTGVTSEVTNHSEKESFYGASVFAEKELANGFVIGLDWVPMDIELGSGERIDTDGAIAADNDDGTRKASADVENLFTLYTHVPLGPMYLLLGYHDADVTTGETGLPNSTYGDASLNGIQYGLGVKGDHARMEIAYSDFDSIELTSSNDSTQKITADADALMFRLSFNY